MKTRADWWKDASAESARVAAFLAGSGRRFVFTVGCPVEIRIAYIYRVIFPGFRILRFYGRFMVARVAQWSDFPPVKRLLYRLIGVRVGRGVFISPDAIIDPHFPSLITIGDHAVIGWGAKLFAHEFDGTKYTMGRIDIGRGAIIGAFTIVKNGVSVGDGAMVHAGGVVLRDVSPGARYGPVAAIRDIMAAVDE
jgi:acetyltransferase-like isoleucine patch superfamily enzyme